MSIAKRLLSLIATVLFISPLILNSNTAAAETSSLTFPTVEIDNSQVSTGGDFQLKLSFVPGSAEAWINSGPTNFKILDKEEVLCEVVDYLSCGVANFLLGSHELRVLATNGSGTFEGPIQPYTYCFGEPEIQISDWNTAFAGEVASIEGQAENMCTNPKKIYYRFKQTGSSWSSWKSASLTKESKSNWLVFGFKIKLNTNSTFEIKVTDNKKTYIQKQEISVALRNTVKVDAAAKRNKQGFNQGGVIGVIIKGDQRFNGNCFVSLKNDLAYNFAGTYAGFESASKSFKVKNGNGATSIAMRWNGKIKITTTCKVANYADVRTVTYKVFKPNF